MRKLHYRAGKNAAAALLMGGLTIMCAMLWWRSGGFISLGGFLLFGAGAAKSATDAIGDEPATSSEPEVPLARYMDRKSESQPLSSAAPAAGAAVPAAPARPAFGRKGL